MNNTFHYYFTFGVALEAGFQFEEGQILAQSAALVDFVIFPINIIDSGSSQTTIGPTQNYGYGDQNALPIWYPFHYVPSLEQKTDFVMPSNSIAKALLIEALKSKNLYAIGIALHTYADTWAHQNFIGKLDPRNNLLPNSPLPAVGHAQAGFTPDIFGVSWIDPRNPDEVISNQERFLQANRVIYKYLAAFTKKKAIELDKDLLCFTELTQEVTSWEFAKKYGGLGQVLSHQSLALLIEARWTGPKDLVVIEHIQKKYRIPKFDKNLWGSLAPNQKYPQNSHLAEWAVASEGHRRAFNRLSGEMAHV